MHGIVGCWLGPQGASITFQPVQNDEKKNTNLSTFSI